MSGGDTVCLHDPLVLNGPEALMLPLKRQWTIDMNHDLLNNRFPDVTTGNNGQRTVFSWSHHTHVSIFQYICVLSPAILLTDGFSPSMMLWLVDLPVRFIQAQTCTSC